MVHTTTDHYFPGFGKCIYCGAKQNLTDEHIIPLSLGGKHVLSNASCRNCAKRTSRLERKIARDFWGDARLAYDAPSRRKSRNPKYLDMDGLRIRADQFPGQFIFYHMPAPGILEGLHENVDTSRLWKLCAYGDKARLEKLHQKHPSRVKFRIRHFPTEFGQLLIKVGYTQTLTVLSPDELQHSFAPYIFSEKPNVSYIVGCAKAPPIIPKGLGSFLGNYMVGDLNKVLIVAQIQIFSELSSPVYDVVVGTVEGRENIKNLLPRIGLGDSSRRLFSGP